MTASAFNRLNGESINSVAALRWDHSDIETMCSVLEAAVSRLEQGGYVDRQMLSGILRFFDQFVGQSHQLKGEQALSSVKINATLGRPVHMLASL
jgi:hemerythrin-like domain-containing protein